MARVSVLKARQLLIPGAGVMVVLLAGCASTAEQLDVAESMTSESLPLPEYEEAAPAEAGAAEEPDAEIEAPCVLEASASSAAEQVARFRRWLQDQSVGRRVLVESLAPLCGDRAGYLVLQGWLTGPAGGLQSLSRALESYYPGSAWTAINYERLAGDDVPLRLNVEIRVPTGASPRPRCTWDESIPCPELPAVEPEQVQSP